MADYYALINDFGPLFVSFITMVVIVFYTIYTSLDIKFKDIQDALELVGQTI